jgi:hypothetical protein
MYQNFARLQKKNEAIEELTDSYENSRLQNQQYSHHVKESSLNYSNTRDDQRFLTGLTGDNIRTLSRKSNGNLYNAPPFQNREATGKAQYG